MKKALVFAALAAFLFGVELPKKALAGGDYYDMWQEYEAKFPSLDDIYNEKSNTYDFKKQADVSQEFCQKGLRAACGELGDFYALGLGIKRDTKEAQKLYKFAGDDSEHKGFAMFYDKKIELVQSAANVPDEKIIAHFKEGFVTALSQCKAKQGEKDVCFDAMAMITMLPDSQIDMNEEEAMKSWEDMVVNDVDRNGLKNSKTNAYVKDLDSFWY